MRLIDELHTFYNTKPRILDLTNGRLPAVHMVTKLIITSHQLSCNTSIIPTGLNMLRVICFSDQLPTLLDSYLQMEFAYGYIGWMSL